MVAIHTNTILNLRFSNMIFVRSTLTKNRIAKSTSETDREISQYARFVYRANDLGTVLTGVETIPLQDTMPEIDEMELGRQLDRTES